MKNEKNVLPFDQTKEVDARRALGILRTFYLEVRREIKKNTAIVANGRVTEETASFKFIADGFNLEFIVTEGGTL